MQSCCQDTPHTMLTKGLHPGQGSLRPVFSGFKNAESTIEKPKFRRKSPPFDRDSKDADSDYFACVIFSLRHVNHLK